MVAIRDLIRDLEDYQKRKKLKISLLTVLGNEPIASRKTVNNAASNEGSDRMRDSVTLAKIQAKEGLQVSSETREKFSELVISHFL